MVVMSMATKIQLRRGTASAWTLANPVLAEGEIGLETDTNKFKIGDGSMSWTSLRYSNPISSEDINYETLNANGDVGTGSSQVAKGDHNHNTDYEPKNTNIQSHISNTSNPHSVDKVDVGLGNVDNISITSGITVPTGGSDGDIYLQYE
jgi:hypothetical protein